MYESKDYKLKKLEVVWEVCKCTSEVMSGHCKHTLPQKKHFMPLQRYTLTTGPQRSVAQCITESEISKSAFQRVLLTNTKKMYRRRIGYRSLTSRGKG